MYINSIELNNFRNYEYEEISFDKNVNVITGKNAQGKTNLIESIYLCSFGKSFRTNRDRDLIKFNSDFCRVVAVFDKNEKSTVEMAISKEGKKAGKIDGRKIEKTSELLDNIITVIFSPEDLKIVKEDPEKRRLFINRELSQLKPSYLNCLKQYNRILAQRNAYLKENENEKNGLFVWDEKLIDYGDILMQERDIFIKKISAISGNIHKNITNGKEKLTVKYRPNIKIDESNQKDAIRNALEDNLKNDFLNGNTGKGPHKDDFEIVINGINARNFGSQGQQRTAALSLKLAEIELLKEEKEDTPILLLDDVLSELDSERQKYLIEALDGVQLFITAAGLADELKTTLKNGKSIKIENGKVINK